MKTLLQLFIALSISIISQAQTLPGINYQALLRNAEGQPLATQTIMVQVSILFGSATGTAVYTETHNATTNAFGQINLSIGEGEPTVGVFDAINWGNGIYYLKTAMDLAGSSDYKELETVRFYSVPYSYHSNTANVANVANIANVASVANVAEGVPSMTYTERDAIENPTIGMQIFNTISGCVNYYNGDYWIENCGEKVSFQQCGDLLIDYRDGKKYQTVQIGTQCWMAENLNVGILIDGNSNQTNNSTIEKYCYNNSESNCTIYGGLYQWDEMMNYSTTAGAQGICPPDWHLPTDAEWTTLTTYLGGESVAGGKMKEAGTTHWNSPNTGATNASGFTGLPGGLLYDGIFYNIGSYSFFWSSTEYDIYKAWDIDLYFSNPEVGHSNHHKEHHGFSVRCIKD